MQAYASVETGLWYARSAEFLQQPLIENLRWLRVVGDTIFLIGVAAFAWFMAGLRFGWSYGAEPAVDERLAALPIRRTA
jgi:nitric oxide reductase subunit B